MLGYGSPVELEECAPELRLLQVDPAARPHVLGEAPGPGVSIEEELELRRKDGQSIWVSLSARAVRDEAGKQLFVQGFMTDISERVRWKAEIQKLNAELEQRVVDRTAQLEAANKEMEAFTYTVSHNLRSPLRSVDGFSRILVEDHGPQLPEECRRYLGLVRAGAQRMGRLIDDLLAFSRLGRQVLRKRPVDVVATVQQCLEESRQAMENRRVEVRVGDLPKCDADPALLKQVLANLLENALKYTRKREAAVVEIGHRRVQDEVVYFVADNGVGFDMRYVDRLFGVFQRLHRPDDYEGTGVGLATVKRIVERHGGRVWAESQLDRGTTVSFTLPASPEPPGPSA
jgi:light-regulated signal transduction histidine kinase (bacteriophytochrome)